MMGTLCGGQVLLSSPYPPARAAYVPSRPSLRHHLGTDWQVSGGPRLRHADMAASSALHYCKSSMLPVTHQSVELPLGGSLRSDCFLTKLLFRSWDSPRPHLEYGIRAPGSGETGVNELS